MEKHRENIDLLDSKIFDLLEKRFNISKEIGLIKKERSINVNDSNRENDILSKINKYSNSDSIKKIYKEIFKISKDVQTNE